MKKIIIGILYAFIPCLTMAQSVKNLDSAALITPYHLQITNLKTTVILFPTTIKSVDRGSQFVLAEKVKDADNVLKLKAQRLGLPESNLRVITADGKLYSFIIDDSANLPYQAIDLRKQEQKERTTIAFADAGLNEVQIKDISAHISILPPFLNHNDKEDDMKLQLEGIYMAKDLMFYQFKINNNSHINYSIDFTRFYVRDKKKVKRMAIQEQEIVPIAQYPDSSVTINGRSHRTIVLAFKKFTIADNKNLAIELYEKNGDRHLAINVNGKEILKARPIER